MTPSVAIDTNVLVRFMANDDRAQADRVERFLHEQRQVYIPKTMLLEVEWVLRTAIYKRSPVVIAAALRQLTATANIEIEDEDAVSLALDWYEGGMDFADALHVASAGRERKFGTFDNALRRKLRGLGRFIEI
jgi:predicted nucleic-acid-binding protein